MEEGDEHIADDEIKAYWKLAKHLLIVFLSSVAGTALVWYFPELVLLLARPWIVWLALVFVVLSTLVSVVILFVMIFSPKYAAIWRGGIAIAFALVLILAALSSWIVVKYDPLREETQRALMTAPLKHLSFDPRALDMQKVERLLEEYVNEERQKQQLSNLEHDEQLAKIARAHSEDMAAHQYLKHVNLRGEDAIARGNKAGYPCKKDYGVQQGFRTESAGIGENLALTPIGNVLQCGKIYSEEALARCTMRNWVNSSDHRKNVLAATYDKAGIGVARFKNDFYITQNFC